jgi:hypothetical protein
VTRTIRQLKLERNAPQLHDAQRPPRERVSSNGDCGEWPSFGVLKQSAGAQWTRIRPDGLDVEVNRRGSAVMSGRAVWAFSGTLRTYSYESEFQSTKAPEPCSITPVSISVSVLIVAAGRRRYYQR